ncbi:MAG: hypothetical protein EOO98_00030 [Pedobacter sp.]|nr:MAG: hypothetical protein EOO98_00030 [Pedobacter sp.]
MKKYTKICFAGMLIFLGMQVQAQVKVGNNLATINPDAALEVEHTNKGLLLPRVALTSTADFAPLTAHVLGMTVYNTATTGDVKPGYYYNDGVKWVKLATGNDAVADLPWKIQTTTNNATLVSEDIYHQGKVAIGVTASDAPFSTLEVKGDINAIYTGMDVLSITDNNYVGFIPVSGTYTGEGTNAMFSSNTLDPNFATRLGYVFTTSNFSGGLILTELGSKNVSSSANLQTYTSSTSGAKMATTDSLTNRHGEVHVNSAKGIQMSDALLASKATVVTVNAESGIAFSFTDANGGPEGRYVFPSVNGAANQVLTTDGNAVTSTLAWRNVSDLISNQDWKLAGNAGTNPTTSFLGTTDEQPLVLRTNNVERLHITDAGLIGVNTNLPNSTVQVNGSTSYNVRAITTDEALTDTDYTVISRAPAAINLTLPDPTTCKGRVYYVINNGVGPITTSRSFEVATGQMQNYVPVAASGIQSINSNFGNKYRIQSDGTLWVLIQLG